VVTHYPCHPHSTQAIFSAGLEHGSSVRVVPPASAVNERLVAAYQLGSKLDGPTDTGPVGYGHRPDLWGLELADQGVDGVGQAVGGVAPGRQCLEGP
jgi:hypothetical protein